MRSKILSVLFALFLTVVLVSVSVAQDENITDDPKELFKQTELFADSITIISKDYVEPVTAKELIYGAMKGMMGTLDGYSEFMDPESFKEITEETKGEFGGVGIEIGMRDDVLTVIAPIEDSPAYDAGVEAGDKIVKIGEETTREMTLDDAVKRLKGEPGTEVAITVIRPDTDELLEFAIERAVIKLKSIKDARVIDGDIAYVKLVEFQERTARDFRNTVKDLRNKGATSLVIDLRNNPGGLFESSIEVADQFLRPGAMIVYTEGRSQDLHKEYKSKKEPVFEEMDLVIIINRGSASAAEILAGAIKDNKRGILVGETSFGKGSVQTVIGLKDKSALRLTTAAYYTPSGRTIRDKGIDPDIVVKRIRPAEEKDPENEKKKEIFSKIKDEKKKEEKVEKSEDEDEDILAKDNQLQAAVNVLKGARIFEAYKGTNGQ